MTRTSKSQKTVNVQEQETKGVSTMATANLEKVNLQPKNNFDAMNYVKSQLLQMSAAGKKQVKLAKPNTDVFDMLMNLGAIEGYTIENKATNIDEEGKRFVVVTVEGLDINATAISKRTGNKYYIFFMGNQ